MGYVFFAFIKGTWFLRVLSAITLGNKCRGKHNISICIESKKPNDRNNTRSSGQSNTASMTENNTNRTVAKTNNFTSNRINKVKNVFL